MKKSSSKASFYSQDSDSVPKNKTTSTMVTPQRKSYLDKNFATGPRESTRLNKAANQKNSVLGGDKKMERK